MATHDYVIANGTGAAVRSDLNGALAAIVSNNSSATAPATTYAYQWWADTTTGLLKLRNSANSAWISLFQLDGEWSTLPIENGTFTAPSIYFKDSGTDTGFYSPGADQIGISTGGTSRIIVDASGNVNIDSNTLYVDAVNNRVGFGTSSPGSILDISDNQSGTNGTLFSTFKVNGSFAVNPAANGAATAAMIQVKNYTITGAGFLYNKRGIVIEEQTGGTYNVNLLLGTQGAYNDPGDSYSIYSASTKKSYLGGSLGIGTNPGNANGGILQLSSGITFPATAVAASDANTLDDYEEGSWTPTWSVATGSITANSNTSGRYTKIGRTVFIVGYISYQSNSSASGAVTVGGLPFTAGAGFGQSNNRSGGVYTIGNGFFTSNSPNIGNIPAGNTIIEPIISTATGGTGLTFADFNTGANLDQFVFAGQYNI